MNRRALFLERSLKNSLDFFKEAVFSEDIARRKGLIQSLDPRIKIISLLVLLFAICFIRSIPALAALYFFSVILAFASGINILFFVERVWFFIPLFTLVIAVPAFFMDSVYSAAVFIVRVATCVSYSVLLILTTRHDQILRSLRSIGISNIFVQVLDMTYRYIFFFVKVFEEMHLALKARLVRNMNSVAARRWIGSRIGYIFKRSVKMSEDVYMAMLARGYSGEFKKYG